MKILLPLAIALTAASPAWPHAQLESASPRVGARIAASPAELRLTFDEDLTPRQSGAALFDVAGRPVTVGAARVDAKDASLMIVPLVGPLPAGRYRVRWRAVSPDRHTNTGDYSFTVAP